MRIQTSSVFDCDRSIPKSVFVDRVRSTIKSFFDRERSRHPAGLMRDAKEAAVGIVGIPFERAVPAIFLIASALPFPLLLPPVGPCPSPFSKPLAWTAVELLRAPNQR